MQISSRKQVVIFLSQVVRFVGEERLEIYEIRAKTLNPWPADQAADDRELKIKISAQPRVSPIDADLR